MVVRAVDAGAPMRDRWLMRWLATIAAAALLGLSFAAPATAQSTRQGATAGDVVVQSQTSRPRTRLRVRPIYPYRRYNAVYPPPYDIEYPGPNGRRECVDRYVIEHRPSGTVVVPRMRCWWVGG